jgi:ATP adenylyltransferase
MPVDISIDAPTLSRFSWVVEGLSVGADPVFDRVLAETPSFVAIPTMGSLVAGWCLIVPRRRMLNLTHLRPEEKAELAVLRSRLAHKLGARGRSVFEFEHGAIEAGSATGCGVDQAHLHVVPLEFDLVAAVDSIEPLSVASADPVDLWPSLGGAEYVLVRRASEAVTMGFCPTKPTSQFIRRVIADRIGHSARWDYRSQLGRENALATLELLSN